MEKNAIIAAALSLAILIGWQFLVLRPMEEKRSDQKRAAESQKKAAPSRPATSAPLTAKPPSPQKESAPATTAPAPSEEIRVTVQTGKAALVFTNQGAGLLSATLTDYRSENGKELELVLAGSAELRPLFFTGSEIATRLNQGLYRTDTRTISLSASKPEATLHFVYSGPDGLMAEKIFTFRHNSYAVGMKVRIAQPKTPQSLGLAWGPRLGGADGNTYGGVVEGPMSYVKNKLHYDAPEKGKPVVHGEGTEWVSLQAKYFIAALVPRAGAGGAEVSLLGDAKEINDYVVAVPLKTDARTEAVFDLFVGPKEPARLAKLGVGMENALDYGMFSIIARPLMVALRFFHAIVGNWGFAIILLTILIKIIFYPLTHVSMRNMKEMQRLQPKMAQLKEIYKDDKTKMNEQVMSLYREHKVNPMMGCLPMVIQIPVFFGLYNALLVSIELRNAPFFWWVTDMSKPDPFHVYTILMGASMFLQQKMTPTAGDPSQAKMMLMMPVIFTGMFIYYPVPVGLVIYWLVNNVLSIVQQYFVNRSVKAPKLAEEN
ncbi:MAG: membrane protein insertase YidC [bacterium]|nr:membrane protein insertase YidC [bacterium]